MCIRDRTLGGVFDQGLTVSITSDTAGNMQSEDENDFRESWAEAGDRPAQRPSRHFHFREAGVERFNDVYDDGYDED